MQETRCFISDASKKVDAEAHVLRYWEDELGLDIPRNELGHRYYREDDIDLLVSIKHLKDKGFQLKAIRMLLPDVNKIAKLENDRLADLRDKLDTLLGINKEEEQLAAAYKEIEPKGNDPQDTDDMAESYNEDGASGLANMASIFNIAGTVDAGGARGYSGAGANGVYDEAGINGTYSEAGKKIPYEYDEEDAGGAGFASDTERTKVTDGMKAADGMMDISGRNDEADNIWQGDLSDTKRFRRMDENTSIYPIAGQEMKDTSREGRKVIDMTSVISTEHSEILDERVDNGKWENKMSEFRAIMNSIMSDAVKSNNGTLVKEINQSVSESVKKEVDYLLHLKEEREEERFKKLDRTIREYQLSRQQAAATSEVDKKIKKKSKFFKKNKVRI